MTDELTTLDHIDRITVPGNPFAEPANEYYALLCLRTGLEFLYRQAEKCDQIALKQLDPKKQYFSFGNSPLLTGIPYQLLTCAFHWYSISACQYVRTVGAIAYLQDKSRPIPPEYIKCVIPEVLAFRDKIAAHFAWLSKHSQDNEAERLASSGKSSNSKAMQPWSITKIHQRLQERYWPEEIKME